MEATKKTAVIAYARMLMQKVILANPNFTYAQVIQHTVDGTSEKYQLGNCDAEIVRAALEG